MEKNVNDSGPSSSGESRSSKRKRTDVDQEDSQLFHKDLHKVRIEEHEKKYGHLDEIGKCGVHKCCRVCFDDSFLDIFPVDHFPTVTQAYEHLRLKCALLPISKNTFPVVWRHQLYALFSNRSQVDGELVSLKNYVLEVISKQGSFLGNNEFIQSSSNHSSYKQREAIDGHYCLSFRLL